MTKFRKSVLIFGCIILCVVGALVAFLTLSASGMIAADPIELTFRVEDNDKEYDGTPLYAERYVLDEGELLQGHKAQVTYTGVQTNVGTSQSGLQVRILDEKDRDVTKKYAVRVSEGKLDVTAREIAVEQKDVTREYDGTSVEGGSYVLAEGSTLCAGHRLVHPEDGSGVVNVGVGKDTSTPLVVDALGNDVTANYEIDFTAGNITVEKRAVRIAPHSASKTYDGTPLEAADYDVTRGSLLAGHTLTPIFATPSGDEATQLHVGSCEVRLAGFTVTDVSGKDVSDNYAVESVVATLTVTACPLYIEGEDLIENYNGSEHNTLSFDAKSVRGLAECDSLSLRYTASRTDAGSEPNRFEAYLTGTAQEGDYAISCVFGTLTVRPLTVTAMLKEDCGKTYDGKTAALALSDVMDSWDVEDEARYAGIDEDLHAAAQLTAPIAVCNAGDYPFEVCFGNANFVLAQSARGTYTVRPQPIAVVQQGGEADGEADPAAVTVYLKSADMLTRTYDGSVTDLSLDNFVDSILVADGLNEDAIRNVLRVYTVETIRHAKAYAFSLTLSDARNYTLTGQTDGVYTVGAAALTFAYNKAPSKTYDGTPLKEGVDYSLTDVQTSVTGVKLYAAQCSSSDVNAGIAVVTVLPLALRNTAGEDVTGDYAFDVFTINGQIEKRDLSVQIGDLVIQGDPDDILYGMDLSNAVTVTCYGLVGGDCLDASTLHIGYKFEGSSCVLEAANAMPTILDAKTGGVSENYTVTAVKNGKVIYPL